MTTPGRRREDREALQGQGYAGAERRYYDRPRDMEVIKLFTGDCVVTDAPNAVLMTILGSCVAACIRDPSAKVGGMNHFLLPECKNIRLDHPDEATRYGAFAMEQLINGILKKGGWRDRLEVKVFGGGNVIDNSRMIGDQNARFVREYLKAEGLRITSSDLGGDYPRRIHYYPATGKVMMRNLRRKNDMRVAGEEADFAKTLKQNIGGGDVEFFS